MNFSSRFFTKWIASVTVICVISTCSPVSVAEAVEQLNSKDIISQTGATQLNDFEALASQQEDLIAHQNFLLSIPPVPVAPSTSLIPVDPQTELLMHFDNSITADDSQNGHSVTVHGDTRTDGNDFQFGSNSGYFDGNGDYLEGPDVTFGQNDFAVDFWVNMQSVDQHHILFAAGAEPSGLKLTYHKAGKLIVHIGSFYFNQNWVAQNNQWNHIALSREGNVFRVFVNGQQLGVDLNVVGLNLAQAPLTLGKNQEDWVTIYSHMYMDEFRVSIGDARFTENFTPYDAPYGEEDPGQHEEPNHPPVLTAIQHNAQDRDTVNSGIQIYENTPVIFNSSAQDEDGDALTYQWFYKLSNGTEVLISEGAGPVQSMTFDFSTITVPSTLEFILKVSDGEMNRQQSTTIHLVQEPVVEEPDPTEPSEPLDPETQLLMHFDEAGHEDASQYDHSMNAQGDTAVSNQNKKFGEGSGVFDGAGDYLQGPNIDIGSNDFAVDFWVNMQATNQHHILFAIGAEPNGLKLTYHKAGMLIVHIGNFYFNQPWTASENQWTHIALARDGNSFRVFINGQQLGNSLNVAGLNLSSAPLTIGKNQEDWVTLYSHMHMDEFRVSIGKARFTQNFSPAQVAYGEDDPNTHEEPNTPPVATDIQHNAQDQDANAQGIQAFGDSSVDLSSSASDVDADALTYQWLYKHNNGPETLIQEGQGSPSSTRFDFASFAIGSQFQFILRVSDGEATVEKSFVMSLIARPDVQAPTLIVGSLSAVDLSQTSATIQWQTDEASTTQVFYGKVGQAAESTTLDSNFSTSHSVNLNGLDANSDYFYYIESRDQAGNLLRSAELNFRTLERPNNAPILTDITSSTTDQDLNAQGLQVYAGDSVQLNSSVSDVDGDTLNYQWFYKHDNGAETLITQGQGNPSPLDFSFVSFNAGSVFSFILKASDGKTQVEKIFNMNLIARPDTDAPSIVADSMQVTLLNESQVKFEWQTTEPAQVHFHFGITGLLREMDALEDGYQTSFSHTLSFLIPETTYFYFLELRDEQGNTIQTEAQYFTTPAANQPPQATDVQVNYVDKDTTLSNLQVYVGDTVEFSSQLSDPEQNDLQWEWLYREPGGNLASLNQGSGTSAQVSLRFSASDLNKTYEIVLRVQDGKNTVDKVFVVNIIARPNQAPVVTDLSSNMPDRNAEAAGFQVYNDQPITFLSAISDADQDAMTWSWHSRVNGGAETLLTSGSNALSNLVFNPASLTVPATVQIILKVNDGKTTSEKTFTFELVQAPDILAPTISQNPTINNITHNAASIAWTTNEDSTTQVFYGIVGQTAVSQSTLDSNYAQNHSVNLSSLQADKDYYFYVESRDRAGNLFKSVNFTFRTALAPQGPVAPISVVNGDLDPNREHTQILLGSRLFSAAITAQSGQNISWTWLLGTYGSNELYAMTQGSSATATYNLFTEPNDRNKLFRLVLRVVIAGVTTEREIIVQPVAQSDIGQPQNQAPVIGNITSSTADADASASGFQVHEGSEVSISSSATDPNTSDSLSWQWYYKINNGALILHSQGTGAVQNASFNYTGVAVPSTYTWILKVSDGKVTSEKSFDMMVIAAPDSQAPQLVPGSFSVNVDTYGIGNVVWETNEASTTQVFYGVQEEGQNESERIASNLNEALVTYHRVTLSNLTPGKRYYVIFESKDSRGNIYRSEKQFFVTPNQNQNDTTPPVIETHDIEVLGAINPTEAFLNFTTDERTQVEVTYWALPANANTIHRKTMRSNEYATFHAVYVGDLEPGLEYAFVIAAYDQAGNRYEHHELRTRMPNANASNAAPIIDQVNANVVDANPFREGVQIAPNTVMTLSAQAHDPTNQPLVWTWSYRVDGGDPITYLVSSDLPDSNEILPVEFDYSDYEGPKVFEWILRVSDTNRVVERIYRVELQGSIVNLPPVVGDIAIGLADQDPATAGLQYFVNDVLPLSSVISDPENESLTWKWSYQLPGGNRVIITEGSGLTTASSVTLNFAQAGQDVTLFFEATDDYGQKIEKQQIVRVMERPRVNLPPVVAELATTQADILTYDTDIEIYSDQTFRLNAPTLTDDKLDDVEWSWNYKIGTQLFAARNSSGQPLAGRGAPQALDYRFTAADEGKIFEWILIIKDGAHTITKTLNKKIEVLHPYTTSEIRAMLPDSDDFLKAMINPGHSFLESREQDRWDAGYVAGLRLTFKSPGVNGTTGKPYIFDTNDPANGGVDIFNRDNNGNIISVNYERAQARYMEFINIFRQNHPDTLIGSYVGTYHVKTPADVLTQGHWPMDTLPAELFTADELNPPGPSAVNSSYSVDYSLASVREKLKKYYVERALSMDQDLQYYDEVGFTLYEWQHRVEVMSHVKREVNRAGRVVIVNLGGWNFAQIPTWPGINNVMNELPLIADGFTIEDLWKAKNWNRTDTNLIIQNLRTLMDQDIAITPIPLTYPREMCAAFMMMVRQPGHKAFVHNSPEATANNTWRTWPEEMGNPTGEPVMVDDGSAAKNLVRMERSFEHGKIVIHFATKTVEVIRN